MGCFSICQIVFNCRMNIYSKYILPHLHQSLYANVHLLQFLNALASSPITLFQVSQNLIISSEDNNLKYIYKLYYREQGWNKNGIKKDSFVAKFLKEVLAKIFFKKKTSTKTVLCARGYIFNKVNRGKVQRPDMQLGHRIGLVDDYC